MAKIGTKLSEVHMCCYVKKLKFNTEDLSPLPSSNHCTGHPYSIPSEQTPVTSPVWVNGQVNKWKRCVLPCPLLSTDNWAFLFLWAVIAVATIPSPWLAWRALLLLPPQRPTAVGRGVPSKEDLLTSINTTYMSFVFPYRAYKERKIKKVWVALWRNVHSSSYLGKAGLEFISATERQLGSWPQWSDKVGQGKQMKKKTGTCGEPLKIPTSHVLVPPFPTLWQAQREDMGLETCSFLKPVLEAKLQFMSSRWQLLCFWHGFLALTLFLIMHHELSTWL